MTGCCDHVTGCCDPHYAQMVTPTSATPTVVIGITMYEGLCDLAVERLWSYYRQKSTDWTQNKFQWFEI